MQLISHVTEKLLFVYGLIQEYKHNLCVLKYKKQILQSLYIIKKLLRIINL